MGSGYERGYDEETGPVYTKTWIRNGREETEVVTKKGDTYIDTKYPSGVEYRQDPSGTVRKKP